MLADDLTKRSKSCPGFATHLTTFFARQLVIHGLHHRQKRLPRNRDLHLIEEALVTNPLFGVYLLVVYEAQLEGGQPSGTITAFFDLSFSDLLEIP